MKYPFGTSSFAENGYYTIPLTVTEITLIEIEIVYEGSETLSFEGEKVNITKTPTKVPFVQNSFKGGEMSINGDFTKENYSYVFFHNGENVENYKYIFTDKEGTFGSDLNETNNKNFVSVVSKSYSATYNIDDLTEVYAIQLYSTGVSGYGLTLGHISNRKVSVNTYYLTLVLKGDRQKEDFEHLIGIIKSGNYTLPPQFQGTTFPISDMVRRNDEDGIIETEAFADTTRDIQDFEKSQEWIFRDSATDVETRVKIENVADVWTITKGDAVATNVSGYLRCLANSYVRRAK